jgi:hypothetical protein
VRRVLLVLVLLLLLQDARDAQDAVKDLNGVNGWVGCMEEQLTAYSDSSSRQQLQQQQNGSMRGPGLGASRLGAAAAHAHLEQMCRVPQFAQSIGQQQVVVC